MKDFITNKKKMIMILSVIFWIIIWELVSRVMNSTILLPSPVAVFEKLGHMVQTKLFWAQVANTMGKILGGFLLGLLLGIVLAMLSYKVFGVYELLYPIVLVIKSTPVASFIILALIWVGTRYLSLFIAFLMVLPVVYTNIYAGLKEVDKKLLEMAEIMEVSWRKKLRYIYIPEMFSYYLAAVTLSLGLCWKAGIAAEVIGIPVRSIGEQLYQAKLYLNTEEVLGWTVVVVVLSFLFERWFIWLMKKAYRMLGGYYGKN